MKRRHFFALLSSVWLASCMRSREIASPANSPSSTSLLIAAAASLQEALEAIKPLFEQANPEITLNYTFGASGALQQQIEQGAPVDIFFSAAAKQMDGLETKALILPETRHDLLSNRLVLIVPRDSTLALTEFRQLADPTVQLIAVGEFRSVPAGQYAEEVFKNLGILEPVKAKLVFTNNVRGVLAAVETGNAEAGVVYATDAKGVEQVRQVAVASEELHAAIVYPIAITSRSPYVPQAQRYLDFLISPEATAVFETLGFGIVR